MDFRLDEKGMVLPLIYPSNDGHALAAKLDGEPEVEAFGEVARVPDVGHEEGEWAHII